MKVQGLHKPPTPAANAQETEPGGENSEIENLIELIKRDTQ